MNIGSAFAKLLDTPVPGVLLALAIIAIIFLWKKNDSLRDTLEDELKDRDKNDTYVIKSIDHTMEAILIDLEKPSKNS
jgi:Na+/melibiose symporter-like transporter